MFTEDDQKMLRARSMNNRGALLDSIELPFWGLVISEKACYIL